MEYESLRRFVGTAVIVTGGACGIGRGIAERFASEGAAVLLLDVAGEALEETVSSLAQYGSPLEIVVGDVADASSVEMAVRTAVERFGHLDTVVNNAGIDVHKPLADWAGADFDRVIAVDLKGAFLMCQKAVPALIGRPCPSIVNVASVMARYTTEGYEAYTPAKAGVIGLSRVLAIELGPLGIRVNAICPGYIDTTIWQQSLKTVPNAVEYARKVAALHPLRRRGLPEDIAAATAFLASRDAQFITGTALVVDGGLTAQLPTAAMSNAFA